MPSRNGIVVMARRPSPGETKTRLASALGHEIASRLYEAFLLDTLDACRRVDARLTIAYAPDDGAARAYFSRIAPSAMLVPQPDAPFGVRLARAMQCAFDAGNERVAIVGSDIPHLQPAWISAAFDALEITDAAIGATRDGGYYLLALDGPRPGLFERIDWSSGRELAQTIDRARELHLRVAHVPESFDVDTDADLERLRSLIDTDSTSLCPNTARALQNLSRGVSAPAGTRS